jgi:hypothetical protein
MAKARWGEPEASVLAIQGIEDAVRRPNRPVSGMMSEGCVSRVVEILLSRPPSGLICA